MIPSATVDSFFDIETLSAGTNMTLSYMVQHLTKYADLHFAGSRNRKITNGVYEVDIRFTREKSALDYLTGLNRYQFLTHLSEENVRVIPDGIDVVTPIGDKTLAQQYTAAIFEKPMFTKQPVLD